MAEKIHRPEKNGSNIQPTGANGEQKCLEEIERDQRPR